MGKEDRRVFYSRLEVSRKLSNPQCVGRSPSGQLAQTNDGGLEKAYLLRKISEKKLLGACEGRSWKA